MLNNIIDYIAIPNGGIKLDASKMNLIKNLLNGIDLQYIIEADKYIFINDNLEIHLSRNGNIIMSLAVPPEKTEKGIFILSNITKDVYKIISNNIKDILIEVNIFDNNAILIEEMTNISIKSKQNLLMTFESPLGSKVMINLYNGRHVISLINHTKIEDIMKSYSHIKQGLRDSNLMMKSTTIVEN